MNRRELELVHAFPHGKRHHFGQGLVVVLVDDAIEADAQVRRGGAQAPQAVERVLKGAASADGVMDRRVRALNRDGHGFHAALRQFRHVLVAEQEPIGVQVHRHAEPAHVADQIEEVVPQHGLAARDSDDLRAQARRCVDDRLPFVEREQVVVAGRVVACPAHLAFQIALVGQHENQNRQRSWRPVQVAGQPHPPEIQDMACFAREIRDAIWKNRLRHGLQHFRLMCLQPGHLEIRLPGRSYSHSISAIVKTLRCRPAILPCAVFRP